MTSDLDGGAQVVATVPNGAPDQPSGEVSRGARFNITTKRTPGEPART